MEDITIVFFGGMIGFLTYKVIKLEKRLDAIKLHMRKDAHILIVDGDKLH